MGILADDDTIFESRGGTAGWVVCFFMVVIKTWETSIPKQLPRADGLGWMSLMLPWLLWAILRFMAFTGLSSNRVRRPFPSNCCISWWLGWTSHTLPWLACSYFSGAYFSSVQANKHALFCYVLVQQCHPWYSWESIEHYYLSLRPQLFFCCLWCSAEAFHLLHCLWCQVEPNHVSSNSLFLEFVNDWNQASQTHWTNQWLAPETKWTEALLIYWCRKWGAGMWFSTGTSLVFTRTGLYAVSRCLGFQVLCIRSTGPMRKPLLRSTQHSTQIVVPYLLPLLQWWNVHHQLGLWAAKMLSLYSCVFWFLLCGWSWTNEQLG